MRELRELIEAVNTLLAEVSWHDMGESRVERIRKALATVEAQGTVGWQPIETAPDGNTEFLVYDPDHRGNKVRITNGHWAGRSATHWMPLPEPPKEV